VAAVVDQVFHKTTRIRAFRFGSGEEFQEPCLRLELAAIPIPPVTAVAEVEVGGLILLIRLEELADIADQIVALAVVLSAMELEAGEGFRIDREVVLISEKEA